MADKIRGSASLRRRTIMIQIYSNTDRTLYEHALGFARRQLRALIDRDPEFYPMYTVQGKWRHGGEAWTNWCEGFLPGMLWIVAAREPDDAAGQRGGVPDRVAEKLRHHGYHVTEQVGRDQSAQFGSQLLAGESGATGMVGHHQAPGPLLQRHRQPLMPPRVG